MSSVPDLPGVLSADEVLTSAAHLGALQTASGMIPWYPGGHCDPWNHVESAMALDVAGFHAEAERAYEWLADIQRADGSWHNYYVPDGERDDTRRGGQARHERVRLPRDRCLAPLALHRRPLLRRQHVADRRTRPRLGARRCGATTDCRSGRSNRIERPWDYALLTGTSSIQHALRCGAAVGFATGSPRPDWVEAADVMCTVVACEPSAFEPKERWAMDWYYPVLTGALIGEDAKIRLGDGWTTFAMEGLGVRCVSDEPWVTASETAETAIAFAAIGDFATATDLLAWTRRHRRADGSYVTGLVYPDEIVFPADETTSYTAAAVILAADAITGASPASDLFVPSRLR